MSKQKFIILIILLIYFTNVRCNNSDSSKINLSISQLFDEAIEENDMNS